MDGDIAPLDQMINLADKYGALLFVDDCHGTGTIGKTGKGTTEYYGCLGEVDIITGTFGKGKFFFIMGNSHRGQHWGIYNGQKRNH
jgi:7-keto-8-aminopelargonate synthetase-like enzyme